MNACLLIIVGVIYLFVAGNYYYEGQTGMSIAFVAYAFANLGLYIAGSNL